MRCSRRAWSDECGNWMLFMIHCLRTRRTRADSRVKEYGLVASLQLGSFIGMIDAILLTWQNRILWLASSRSPCGGKTSCPWCIMGLCVASLSWVPWVASLLDELIVLPRIHSIRQHAECLYSFPICHGNRLCNSLTLLLPKSTWFTVCTRGSICALFCRCRYVIRRFRLHAILM